MWADMPISLQYCLILLMERRREYWGGMLERGAVTFWEEFNLDDPREKQYDMYGDKFGKSLCHAWSASSYSMGWGRIESVRKRERI